MQILPHDPGKIYRVERLKNIVRPVKKILQGPKAKGKKMIIALTLSDSRAPWQQNDGSNDLSADTSPRARRRIPHKLPCRRSS